MSKRNNPVLLHTKVSGTGIVLPRIPSVIVGDAKNGYVRGDLMDANAIVELLSDIDAAVSNQYVTKELLMEVINRLLGGAPEEYDTFAEVAAAILEGAVFHEQVTQLVTNINKNTKITVVDGDNVVFGES